MLIFKNVNWKYLTSVKNKIASKFLDFGFDSLTAKPVNMVNCAKWFPKFSVWLLTVLLNTDSRYNTTVNYFMINAYDTVYFVRND